jgi:hypothetical protein
MLRCAAIIALSLLTGCLTTQELPLHGACKSFQIIQPHPTDTPATKRQVLTHNRTMRRVCVD